jgi:hypothetical protein
MIRKGPQARLCVGANSLGEPAQLAEVIEVVAGHGFDNGLEGHGAAFGMGNDAAGGGWQSCVNEREVPVAEGGECRERLGGGDAGVCGGPLVLIEGLDDVVVFGQGLAETEAEDELAVGEMAEDFSGGPFAGGWGFGGFFLADLFEQLCDLCWR